MAAIDELRATWEYLGETDPLWAVLTDPQRRGGRWDVDEFLTTGRERVDHLVDLLGRCSLGLGRHVLDFGCGVGRLSFALAEHAEEVTGVDIAASMIAMANDLNPRPDSIRFEHYDGHLLPFDDDSFDSVVSIFVIQHMPASAQVASLVELQRVVRPGGVLVLQIPPPRRPVDPLPAEAARAEIVVSSHPTSLEAGHIGRVQVRVTNRGRLPWPKDAGIKIGNHWLADGTIAINDDARVLIPGDVDCAEAFDEEIIVTAPPTPGHYELEIDLIQENVAWWSELGGKTVRLPIDVVGTAVAEQAEGTTAELEPQPKMTMIGMEAEFVARVLAHCGCTVVDVAQDALDHEWLSNTYVVHKDR